MFTLHTENPDVTMVSQSEFGIRPIPTPGARFLKPLLFNIHDGTEDIGHLGIMGNEDETAEVAIRLGSRFYGRGYGALAVREVTRYAGEELGYQEIFARIKEDNEASLMMAEKAGFTVVGIELAPRSVVRAAGPDTLIYSHTHMN
jgi:RimJ/RimL family protein N-acetyltransferase